METIEVNGKTYYSEPPSYADSEVRIVIAQRGWVFVGRYSEDGDTVTLDQAKVIRKWGTTKGLGELIDGPKPNTVLDPAGHVEMHRLGVVATLSCKEDAWSL